MYRRYLSSLQHALVIADYAGSSFTNSTLSAIAASKKLSSKTSLAIFSDSKSAPLLAQKGTKLSGVSQVVLLSDDALFSHLLSDSLSRAIVDTIHQLGDVTHVVGSTSSVAKDVLPRVGAMLNCQPVSDVVEIIAPDTFQRPMYAGNVLATLKISTKGMKILSIRPTAFAPLDSKPDDSACPVVALKLEQKQTSCVESFVSSEAKKNTTVDLASASIVVAGGRGLKSRENFDKLLDPLCKKLKAGLGASRAAVDAGFAANEIQIGQTGKVVAPSLYIAIGISGAIQHVAGMKDSKTIVAINKDGDAPIFQIADFGLVGDLNVIVPELTQKLN